MNFDPMQFRFRPNNLGGERANGLSAPANEAQVEQPRIAEKNQKENASDLEKFLVNYENSATIRGSEANTLLSHLNTARIHADISTSESKTTIEFEVNSKHYTLVTNENVSGVTVSSNSTEAKIDNIIKNFASGKLKASEFKEKLKELGIIPTLVNKPHSDGYQYVKKDGYYHYQFTYNNKTYNVKCDYNAAMDETLEVTTFSVDFINQLKPLLSTNINISDFFEISAWEGNNQTDGAICYILKRDISGITENSTVAQVAQILNENDPTAELNEIITQFICGNLKASEFKEKLQELGIVPELANKPHADGYQYVKKDGYYQYKFTYKDKTYNVVCDYNTVYNGINDDLPIFTGADISRIISETEGIFTESDFTKAFWIDGDNSSAKYVMGDNLKSLCNGLKTVDEIIAKIQSSELFQSKKAIKDVDKNNIEAIMNLANTNEHISVLVIKDGEKYKIQFYIDGKAEGEAFDYTNSDAERYRSFSEEEIADWNKNIFDYDSKSGFYKLNLAKVKEVYGNLADTEDLQALLNGVDTLDKLNEFINAYEKYQKEKFLEQFDLSQVPGYNNNENVIRNGKSYRRSLEEILKSGSNSLYTQLQRTLGDKFKSVYENALEAIIKQRENYPKVKDAINALMELIRNSINTSETSITTTETVTLSDEEKAFITNDIKPEGIIDSYKDGVYDDIGDVTDEIEADIEKLKSKIESMFSSLLGDSFNIEEFESIYSDALNAVLSKYENTSSNISVKDVINDFLKKIYIEFIKQQNNIIGNTVVSILNQAEINPEDKHTGIDESNLSKTVDDILKNNTDLKNIVKNKLNISDSELESVWNSILEKVKEIFSNQSEFRTSDVIIVFLQNFILELNKKKRERLENLRNASITDSIDYSDTKESVDVNKIDSTIRSLLNNNSFKSNLSSFVTTNLGITETMFNRLYNESVLAVIQKYTNIGGAVTLSNKDIIDKFLLIFNNKISTVDTNPLNAINYDSIEGYNNNEKLHYESPSGLSLQDRNNYVDNQATLAIYERLKNITEIRTFIKNKLGLTDINNGAIDNVLMTIIKTCIINNVLNEGEWTSGKDPRINIGERINDDGLTWLHVNMRYITDNIISTLRTYFDNNSTSNVYSSSELSNKGFTEDEMFKYFTLIGENTYQINTDAIETNLSEYITQFGSILNIDDLRTAIDYTNDKTKYSNLKSAIGSLNNDETIKDIVGFFTSMHTEFGIDWEGNIVFQGDSEYDQNGVHNNAQKVYDNLKNTIKDKLKAKYPDEYNKLGEHNLDKLVQAAWIMAYNKYNSNESQNSAEFVKQVLENLEAIMNSLSQNPGLLGIYTMHTAYADDNLVAGVQHYGTQTTLSGVGDGVEKDGKWYDEWIDYTGEPSVNNGVVHLGNNVDDPDYQATMVGPNGVLKRVIERYCPPLDKNAVTNIFQKAQIMALTICKNKTHDCPYGTVAGGISWGSYAAPGTASGQGQWNTYGVWHGHGNVNPHANSNSFDGNSRNGDNNLISIAELVQLTLYCFDKLLYAELAGGITNGGVEGDNSSSK